MPGFTDGHLEAERDITERGLVPFRTRFTLHLHKVKAPRHLRDKTIVIACERKKQVAVSPPKRKCEETGDDIVVNEKIYIYLVLARRGNRCDGDYFSNTLNAPSGPSVPGFETAMAQITLRHKNIDGIVLDCVSLNLAKFVTRHHSLSRTELDLQLGGTLEITVEAQIFDQKTQEGNPEAEEDAPNINEIYCKDDALDILDIRPAPESVLPEVSTGKCALESDENSSDDEKSEDGSNAVSWPDDDGVEPPPENETKVNFDNRFADEDCSISRCTSDIQCVGQNADQKHEVTEEHEDPNEDDEYDDGGGTGSFFNRKFTRKPGEEYTTIYLGGTWVEDATIVEVETPRKMIFWSIQGPEEYESDDDSDDEGSPKKHNVMTVSTIKPGPAATPGKMSSLQKSVMRLEKPDPSAIIELGAPISLTKSTVLAATKLLVHDVQYVDEPLLSDSEEVDDDEEDNYSSSTDASSEVSEEATDLARKQSINIRQLDEIDNVPDDPGGGTQNAFCGKQPDEIDGLGIPKIEETETDRVEELTFQLREMEKYIRALQAELTDSLMANKKLTNRIEEMESAPNATNESSRKTSLRSHGSEAETEPQNSPEERKRSVYSVVTATSVSDGTKEYIEVLLKELEAEQQRNIASRREQDRLLVVIEKLNCELHREPAIVEVMNELSEAKVHLAIEKTEREKLERTLQQLQQTSQTKGVSRKKKKGDIFGFTGGRPKSPKTPSKSPRKKQALDTVSPGSSKHPEEFGSPRSVLV